MIDGSWLCQHMRVAQLLRRFSSDKQGATLVFFYLLLIPLGFMMALGIDVSRLELRRSSNQVALDNALISALAHDGANVERVTVQKFFEASGGVGTVSAPLVEVGTK